MLTRQALLGIIILNFGLMNACVTAQAISAADDEKDPYLWLEEVEGDKALEWVKAENEKTLNHFKADEHFEPFMKTAEELLNAEDRIPDVFMMGPQLYNFWRDKDHVRGILRKTTLKEYRKPNPKWQTVLDIDKLAALEEKNWIYKGISCLAPKYELCLVSLSDGGKDAVEVREFNLAKKTFVENGFNLPEAKSGTAWVDADSILVATKFDDNSVTTSGYPRTVRYLKRGQTLTDSTEIFAGDVKDMGVWPARLDTATNSALLIEQRPSFFEAKYKLLVDGIKLEEVKLPLDIEINTAFEHYFVATLKKDWTHKSKLIPQGSVIAYDFKENVGSIEVIYTPTVSQSIQTVSSSINGIQVQLLDQVSGKILTFLKRNNRWREISVNVPDKGTITVQATSPYSKTVLFSFESFLVPPSVWYFSSGSKTTEKIRSMPAKFDASQFVVDQEFATSADGTKIPYYLVHRKDMELNSKNPTLLYGYGGFEIAITPTYIPTHAKLWLEHGGTFAIANIRGGGEFGPRWHQAALLKNRQRAYDDFIATGESLVQSKVTSPEHLGIMGGSNGGLLVGAVSIQRPDLFKGVLCLVPLLDMIRYTKLPPGASWIGEYGDPDVPEMREVIEKYSPYQNIKEGVKYPQILFYTSTKDDRVHPGHPRKMAKKLSDLGNPIYYYENIEGGHAGSANFKQKALERALEFTYLLEKLR